MIDYNTPDVKEEIIEEYFKNYVPENPKKALIDRIKESFGKVYLKTIIDEYREIEKKWATYLAQVPRIQRTLLKEENLLILKTQHLFLQAVVVMRIIGFRQISLPNRGRFSVPVMPEDDLHYEIGTWELEGCEPIDVWIKWTGHLTDRRGFLYTKNSNHGLDRYAQKMVLRERDMQGGPILEEEYELAYHLLKTWGRYQIGRVRHPYE